MDGYGWVDNQTILVTGSNSSKITLDLCIPGFFIALFCLLSLWESGGGFHLTEPNLQGIEALYHPSWNYLSIVE